MNTIRMINITNNMSKYGKKSTFEKLLPYLLIVSYAWLYFFTEVRDISANLFGYDSAYLISLILGLLFLGACEYLILLVVLWIYRTIMAYRPYFYLVSVRTFNSHIKFWIIIKNLILGLLSMLLFYFPYLEAYSEIVEFIFGFLVIVCTYFSLQKYIDEMFRHMYFKLMVYPWFVYQIISILLSIVFGGI